MKFELRWLISFFATVLKSWLSSCYAPSSKRHLHVRNIWVLLGKCDKYSDITHNAIGNHVLGVNMMNTGVIVDCVVVGKNVEKLFLL